MISIIFIVGYSTVHRKNGVSTTLINGILGLLIIHIFCMFQKTSRNRGEHEKEKDFQSNNESNIISSKVIRYT
jgi:hypothetical protein